MTDKEKTRPIDTMPLFRRQNGEGTMALALRLSNETLQAYQDGRISAPYTQLSLYAYAMGSRELSDAFKRTFAIIRGVSVDELFTPLDHILDDQRPSDE